MNAKIIIGIIVLVALAGGGFFFFNKSKSPSQTSSMQSALKPQGGIFSSIQDALSRSLSLQCSFTDENGRQIISYIKNGAVRADITATDPTQSGSVIVKNNTVYYWTGKQGFMMTMPVVPTGTMQNIPTGTANPGSSQGQSMLASLEKYKNSCKPAVVADTLFTGPTDVTFQDMSKMMPTAGAGSSAVPTSYQQYIQQYQQKYPQAQ